MVAPKAEKEKLRLKERCGNCGKTVIKSASLSLSQWLFRPAECKCETPSVYPSLVVSAADATTGDEIENAQDTSVLPEGTILAGRYRIIKPIGAGGMGQVYKVEDTGTGVFFALKIISAGLAEKRPLAKRFEQEAKAASMLTHPSIAAVYDVGESEENLPFLVMDYLEGPSLEQKLQKDGYIEVPTAISIFVQIAEALSYAHKHGVVHRDIKPSNILLHGTEQDLVKLVDFGIAKVNEQKGVNATKLTQTGELFGSPMYMSPEQCRGDEVDARSDIYSLGCVMFECLTGRPPFQGENPVRIILKHLGEEARPLPRVIGANAGLKYLVARCLSKDPKERYQSADELLQHLHKVREGKRIFSLGPKQTKRAATYSVCAFAIFAAATVGVVYHAIFNSAAPAHLPGMITPAAAELSDRSINTGWDKLDILGQRYLNNGQYEDALKHFESASVFPDATENQKILSLKKMALVQRIQHEHQAEADLDKKIATKLQELDKKEHRVSDFQIRTLAQSLKSISNDKETTSGLAKELVAVCEELLDRGKNEEALKLASSSIDGLEKVLGRKATVVLQLKNLEAEALYKHGSLKDSLAKTETLVQSIAQEKSKDRTLMNVGLLRLALINNDLGNGAQSEPFVHMLMENIDHTPKLKNSDLDLRTMLAYGKSLWLQSKVDDGIAQYKKTLSAAMANDNLPVVDAALTDLTNAYAAKNDFKAAESELVGALKAADQKPLLVKANYSSLLGGLYFRQNRTTGVNHKAGPYFNDALTIYQHLLSPDSPKVTHALEDVMSFQLWQGSTQGISTDAIAKQLAAILERKLGNEKTNLETADGLMLTKVYARLTSQFHVNGDRTTSKLYAEKTMDRLIDDPETSNIIDEKFYDAVSAVMGNDGLNRIRDFMEARAKRIEAARGDGDIRLAFALDDVAHFYARMGDMNKAGQPIERAAKIVRDHEPESLDGQYRWLAAGVLMNYAYYLARTGHPNQSVLSEAENYRYQTKNE